MESDSTCRYSLVTAGGVAVALTIAFIIVFFIWAIQSANSGAAGLFLVGILMLPVIAIGTMVLAAMRNLVMCGSDASVADWIFAVGWIPLILSNIFILNPFQERVYTPNTSCPNQQFVGRYSSSDGSSMSIIQNTDCGFIVGILPKGQQNWTSYTMSTMPGAGGVAGTVLGSTQNPLRITMTSPNVVSDGTKNYSKVG